MFVCFMFLNAQVTIANYDKGVPFPRHYDGYPKVRVCISGFMTVA